MDNIRKKTSMQDIAEELGISKNAVSLALNNKTGISEQLRAKVIQTAIAMNYGGYGRLGDALESKLVAICLPSVLGRSSQFYSAVYWSIEHELGKYGYRSLIISVTQEMEQALQLPAGLDEGKVKAVILVGGLSKQYVEKVSRTFRNTLLVDNYFLNLPIKSVNTANIEGGYEATQYLLSQGHTRIGFAGTIHTYLAYRERHTGYTLAMSDAGIPVIPELSLTEDSLFDNQDKLDLAIGELRKLAPDALICSSDRVAIQLITRMHAAGIHIPGDVSIIGFDDIETADIVNPPLTTMQVPRTEMGRRAALMLVHQLEGEEYLASSVVIYPKLVVRESVKPKSSQQHISH